MGGDRFGLPQTGLCCKLDCAMNPPIPNPAAPPVARELAALNAQMMRPAQNVNRDGSFELGWGFAVLCFGFAPYFGVLITHSKWFPGWMSWITFLPLLCAALGPYAVQKVIQRYITWPRTGYVANLNELTLGYLVRLIIFAGALGGCLGLLFTMGFDAVQALNRGGAGAETAKFISGGVRLLIFAAIAAYLGPKVIRKRQPLPTAYEASTITEGLGRTPAGRAQLRTVKLVIFALFVGIPICVFACVIGLFLWNKALFQRVDFQGPQLIVASFLVAMNALLYIMGGGLALKPNRWKWLLLPVMILAPILAAPAIPNPAIRVMMPSPLNGLSPVMLCLGAVWFLSGLIALGKFVRANPLPPSSEDQ